MSDSKKSGPSSEATNTNSGVKKMKPDLSHALHCWPSSILLAQHVWSSRAEFAGKTVLELGAGGTGLPGITAYKSGASRVIFTDQPNHTEAYDLLRKNCRQNGMGSGESGEDHQVEIFPLNWGDLLDETLLLLGDEADGGLPYRIDYILAADCFFDYTVFGDLIATISFLLHRSDQARGFEKRTEIVRPQSPSSASSTAEKSSKVSGDENAAAGREGLSQTPSQCLLLYQLRNTEWKFEWLLDRWDLKIERLPIRPDPHQMLENGLIRFLPNDNPGKYQTDKLVDHEFYLGRITVAATE